MQTFLPYADFYKSAQSLDRQRLGKQRVECLQIYQALTGKSTGWINHPATRMWKGYTDALAMYMEACIKTWKAKGFKNTIEIPAYNPECQMPPWLGDEKFHLSHQSNLIRKWEGFYRDKFGDNVPSDLPYVWPV